MARKRSAPLYLPSSFFARCVPAHGCWSKMAAKKCSLMNFAAISKTVIRQIFRAIQDCCLPPYQKLHLPPLTCRKKIAFNFIKWVEWMAAIKWKNLIGTGGEWKEWNLFSVVAASMHIPNMALCEFVACQTIFDVIISDLKFLHIEWHEICLANLILDWFFCIFVL